MGSRHRHEAVWDTSYYGGEWNWLWEHNHVKFSVYDIATSTLTSQILDTSIVERFEGDAVSCFDPTGNTLYVSRMYNYAVGGGDDDDTTYICALDVTTGNFVLTPVDIGTNIINDPWSGGTSPLHGDTLYDINTDQVMIDC